MSKKSLSAAFAGKGNVEHLRFATSGLPSNAPVFIHVDGKLRRIKRVGFEPVENETRNRVTKALVLYT